MSTHYSQQVNTKQHSNVYMLVPEFEKDGTVSNYMEKLVPKTCPCAENLNRQRKTYDQRVVA